ncbi:MAG: TIGR01459 family HAD-type hydrolase [Paracoccaceae bacterium]
MTRFLATLEEVAGDYDAVVFDQWGVLHDGSRAYPGAVAAVEGLGVRRAVLSNSGKRAGPNAARIARFGFDAGLWDMVMTSGEAFARAASGRLWAIEARAGDAAAWAEGLEVELTEAPEGADATLLMGLPEGSDGAAEWAALRETSLPLICTNPDRSSPRAGGFQVGPGALAARYAAAGGDVTWYGKPHRPVFDAVARALGTDRLLMVGDSPAHDVAGAKAAGWDACLVAAGLGRDRIDMSDPIPGVRAFCEAEGAPMPDVVIGTLA